MDTDKVLNNLDKSDWEIIYETRLNYKRQLLTITKHSKKREALIKEIKWLEDIRNED